MNHARRPADFGSTWNRKRSAGVRKSRSGPTNSRTDPAHRPARHRHRPCYAGSHERWCSHRDRSGAGRLREAELGSGQDPGRRRYSVAELLGIITRMPRPDGATCHPAGHLIDVTAWHSNEDFPIHPLGSKPKRVLVCPDDYPDPALIPGHSYLFKIADGRRAPQLWSEVIAFRIELARKHGTRHKPIYRPF
jgi:hypothetical protein